MKLDPIELTTKSGLVVTFRSPSLEEARLCIDYLRQVCAETPYLSSEPEEIAFTDEQERAYIAYHQQDPLSLNVNVYADGCLAGNASIKPPRDCMRMRHRAVLGIALYEAYCGMGIGEMLISFLIDKAREAGYETMELQVHAANTRAIRLYQKLGFTEWGRMKKSVKFRDGTYDDELFMQLDLTK